MKRKAIYLKKVCSLFQCKILKRRIKKIKKEKTLQEVQEQIFELQEEKEKCDVKLKQLQNQGKKLEKLANEKERKRRNHRLIQRGLIVERVIENPLLFTDEEIEKMLKIATDTAEYQKAYDEVISKKDMKNETELAKALQLQILRI